MASVLAPPIVRVLAPFVNPDPAPPGPKLPESVIEPVVSVIVPLVPPVMVPLATATADAFAVRTPPLPTFNAPPVSPRFAVASAVVEVPSETISVPAQLRALADIVNACGAAAEEAKGWLLNSLPARFAPPNVIVPPP